MKRINKRKLTLLNEIERGMAWRGIMLIFLCGLFFINFIIRVYLPGWLVLGSIVIYTPCVYFYIMRYYGGWS